jgi:hypothetical protein
MKWPMPSHGSLVQLQGGAQQRKLLFETNLSVPLSFIWSECTCIHFMAPTPSIKVGSREVLQNGLSDFLSFPSKPVPSFASVLDSTLNLTSTSPPPRFFFVLARHVTTNPSLLRINVVSITSCLLHPVQRMLQCHEVQTDMDTWFDSTSLLIERLLLFFTCPSLLGLHSSMGLLLPMDGSNDFQRPMQNRILPTTTTTTPTHDFIEVMSSFTHPLTLMSTKHEHDAIDPPQC